MVDWLRLLMTDYPLTSVLIEELLTVGADSDRTFANRSTDHLAKECWYLEVALLRSQGAGGSRGREYE